MLFDKLVSEYTKAKTVGAYHTKTVRLNTWEGYGSCIRLYLMPQWGSREVEEIQYDEVQSWVDSFPEGRGAEKAYKCLRQMLRWALAKLHLRFADPTIGVEVPNHERRSARVLTERELNRMVKAMQGKPWEPVVLVQACLGLRRCEACALTWADVNLGTGVVRITKGRHVVSGKCYVWGTKTKKSNRELVLPWFAVERLREIRKERRARGAELLCELRPDAISRQFRAWCKTHGFPGMTMMQLRHTFATLAVKAGIPIEGVAMMLGHSDVTMCYTRYVSSSEGLFRSAIKRWSAMLLGAAPDTRLDEVSPMWEHRRSSLGVVSSAA